MKVEYTINGKEITFDCLANDLRASTENSGGFVFTQLYDADDHDRFYLNEDEIISLRNYLNRVIKENNLE